MDILFLFPAEDSLARVAVELSRAVTGAAPMMNCTLAAVQTPSSGLPAYLAQDVQQTFDLPGWPFDTTNGLRLPDQHHPAMRSLTRTLRGRFDRVVLFGWQLAPLAALLPADTERFLALNKWSLQDGLTLSPELDAPRSGPSLQEVDVLVSGFSRILGLEQNVHAMAARMFPDLALACPVPIPGWPSDMAESWPVSFRAPPTYSPRTHDGLRAFMRRQHARSRRGAEPVTLQLPPEYGFLRQEEESIGGSESVFTQPEGPHAPLLNVTIELGQVEFRARHAMSADNLMFLLEAQAAGSTAPDAVISPAGQRVLLQDLQQDRTAWRTFWSDSVAAFRAMQDRNLTRWTDLLRGRTPTAGEFLFPGGGVARQGGNIALYRALSLAPLDPAPTLALVEMLLEAGQPEEAVARLRPVVRAGRLSGNPVQVSDRMLGLLQAQSVFTQGRSYSSLQKLCNELQVCDEDALSRDGMSATDFLLPDAAPEATVRVSRRVPVHELGLTRTERGTRRFQGSFTTVFARQAIQGDPDFLLMISGRLDNPDAELSGVQVEADGNPVQAELTLRPDGTFFLPVPVQLQGQGPGASELFSVSVMINAAGGGQAGGELTQFDMMRTREALGQEDLFGQARILAIQPCHDNWPMQGSYDVEHKTDAPPVRWLQAHANPELVWVDRPDEDKRPDGAICALIVLQASRTGPPPDTLFLQTPLGPRKMYAVGAQGVARAYLCDLTELFPDRIRLPQLKLVSPVPGQPGPNDARNLSILLRSFALVRLPLDQLPARTVWGRKDTDPDARPLVPVHLDGKYDVPPQATRNFVKTAELRLPGLNLLSPSRLLEIQGRSDASIHGLDVEVNQTRAETTHVELSADGGFIWQGRLTESAPAMSLISRVKLEILGAQQATETRIDSIRMMVPQDREPCFELMEEGNFPRMSNFYHSGPFMRGNWADSGAQLFLDLPPGARSVWLAGDAATGRKPIEAMAVTCDGLRLDSRATLAADGRWRVEGLLPEPSKGRIGVIGLTSNRPPGRLLGMLRYAGCRMANADGSDM